MRHYTHCACCGKLFRKSRRNRTYPHKKTVPALPALHKRLEAEPAHETTDYGRPVIVKVPQKPTDHPYYPFCTLRCGFDYGATMALGADINALRQKKGGAS